MTERKYLHKNGSKFQIFVRERGYLQQNRRDGDFKNFRRRRGAPFLSKGISLLKIDYCTALHCLLAFGIDSCLYCIGASGVLNDIIISMSGQVMSYKASLVRTSGRVAWCVYTSPRVRYRNYAVSNCATHNDQGGGWAGLKTLSLL